MTINASPLPANDTNDRLIAWILEIIKELVVVVNKDAYSDMVAELESLRRRVAELEQDRDTIEDIFQSQEENGKLKRI
jgi:hypothetical protein